MVLKSTFDKIGLKVNVVKDNIEISTANLKEFPYFYAKRYNLWDYFEYKKEEKDALDKMTLQEVYALGNKEIIKPISNGKEAKSDNSIADNSK